MEAVYGIWILRKDSVLERMTDEEGMPIEEKTLQAARQKAGNIARESHIQEVYIRETRTVETIPGSVK